MQRYLDMKEEFMLVSLSKAVCGGLVLWGNINNSVEEGTPSVNWRVSSSMGDTISSVWDLWQHPPRYWTSLTWLNILHSFNHPSQYITEHPPQYWTSFTVPKILYSTEHPLQYWTSSTVLNIPHNTEHHPQHLTSPTVLNIIHSTDHPPRYWTCSTLLDIIHSTEHPPLYL